MGLGTRFDPGVIGTPLSVVGGLLDELVGALAKSAKGGEGDRLEVDVQALLLDDVVRATILQFRNPYNSRMGSGVERPHLKANNSQQLSSYYNVLVPLKKRLPPTTPFSLF